MHNIYKNNHNTYQNDLQDYKSASNQTQQIFQDFSQHQLYTFKLLNQKCHDIQTGISGIDIYVKKLQQKMDIFATIINQNKMSKLKNQQNQFIINQVKDKNRKLQDLVSNLEQQIINKQSQYDDIVITNQKLAKLNLQLATTLDRKNSQIRELMQTNSFRKSKDALSPKKQNSDSDPTFRQIDKYEKLQNQLVDLEKVMNAQIEEYKKNNIELQEQIKQLKSSLEDKQSMNNNKYEKMIYQIQLKYKNLKQENKQLEESYDRELQKNNDKQLEMHKKINQLKSNIQKQKKQNKVYKAQVQRQLKNFCKQIYSETHTQFQINSINPIKVNTMLIGTISLKEQFKQVKSSLIKYVKRLAKSLKIQITVLEQQKKLQIQNKQKQIKNLQKQIGQLKQKIDKQKLNNNSGLNSAIAKNSSINSESSSTKEGVKQAQRNKYKNQINNLREQIKKLQQKLNKQRHNFDMAEQKLHDKLLVKEARQSELEAEMGFLQDNIAEKMKQMQENTKKYENRIEQMQHQKEQIIRSNQDSASKMKLQMINKDDQIRSHQRKIRELQKKITEMSRKYKAKQQKMGKIYNQTKITIKNKQKIIQELINKNQSLNIQCKLTKQKNKINDLTIKQLKQSLKDYQLKLKAHQHSNSQILEHNKNNNQQLQHKYEQLDKICSEQKQQIQNLNQELRTKTIKYHEIHNQYDKQVLNKHSIELKINSLQSNNQILKNSLQKHKSEIQNQHIQLVNKMKKEHESNILKLEEQITNLKSQLQSRTYKQQKELNILKNQNQKLKAQFKSVKQEMQNKEQQIRYAFDVQTFKQKKAYDKQIRQYKIQIQKLSANQSSTHQVLPQKQHKIKKISSIQYNDRSMNTACVQKKHVQTNTDNLPAQNKSQLHHSKNIKILNDSLNFNNSLSKVSINKKQQKSEFKNSNLFASLQLQEGVHQQDAFQICDEQEAINFGQSAVNLQIRQLFNTMRTQIQKLFNEDDISMSMIKMLPPALQDDYLQFTAYIKQKILQIKNNNEISFIMAQPGEVHEEPSEDSIELPGLIQRHHSENELEYRKQIQEKDALIMSLMTEKNSQQNTINQLTQQKEQIQEQNENRFMNQCNIYKKQIKEHKKMLDTLEMKYQSFKNVIKNILESYSSQDDTEDDFRESMTVYARMAKLNQKDRTRINYHIQRFRQIKNIQ